MKKYIKNYFVHFLLSFVVLFSSFDLYTNSLNSKSEFHFKKLGRKERKIVRDKYFFNMLRDPNTNNIPDNIRNRELDFAKKLPKKDNLLKSNTAGFDWNEVGPNDVGGRTRALAIDVTNSNIVIAGGVSGGIWKSTDKGTTWQLKSSNEAYSITSIVQDPRNGFTNNWYACGGELNGNSASDRGFTARYYGNGLYKSTDNGETWSSIENSKSNPTKWDSNFDYMSKLLIHPTTGTLFAVANGLGIIRSTDGGANFTTSLGGLNDHYFSDIIVKTDGTLIGVISEYGYNDTKVNPPGVYKSNNDGSSWTNITPADFPTVHHRSVLATSKLATPVFYILTFTGETFNDNNENVKLYKLSTDNSVTENLSANLPKFESTSFKLQGHLYTQGSYDLAMAVKPDNDNFVLIAGTSLFRSTNGFSTLITDQKLNWIGGYHPTEFFYPNLHPDIHVIAFDPLNSNNVWVGHDGGLSFTSNISDESYSDYFPWIDKNNGYNVTQFYTVSISKKLDDFRIIGGTQDNGTPFFRWNDLTANSTDFSSGDGSHCYLASSTYAYTSIYNGKIYRFKYNTQGNLEWNANTTDVTPDDATDQLFINPFVIDPVPTERYMYYPAGNKLWRNNDIRGQNDAYDITNYWSEVQGLAMPTNFTITAMGVSTKTPEHVLYYAGYNNQNVPKLYRLENAHTATDGFTDVSISNAPSGTYVHSISINPENGNEILVVLSNYNIVGLYHSVDGGQNYTAVEGNLTGTDTNPGPSIRSAVILPYNGTKYYFIGTSTGLYSTTNLNAENTVWEQEASDKIGNVVVEYLDARTLDGTIAVATHGRGLFIGKANGSVDVNDNIKIENEFSLSQNYPNPFNPSTSIDFTIPKTQNVKLCVYNSTGELVKTLVNKNLVNGKYSINFDANNLTSGIYYYRLESDNFNTTKKMILLK